MIRPLLALLLSSPVLGQVTAIPPFVGDQFEGFETQFTTVGGQHPPTPQDCVIGGVFQGSGTLCDLTSDPRITIAGGSFGSCSSSHRTGSFYAGSLFTGFEISFGSAQAAFGGYFETNNAQIGDPIALQWNVQFFDGAGVALGSTVLQLPSCGQEAWQGWELPSGTVRMEVEPRRFGATLYMDDLQLASTPPLGTTYCGASETSREQRAQCGAIGSSAVADSDLMLVTSQLPPNVFGFFLTSRDGGVVPNPGGSAGILCLQGNIGRFIAPGQILNSGAGGSFSLDIDLDAIPQGAGTTAVVPGDTWRFQAWFRDVTTGSNPMATSNFTTGLAVTFD